eukprot:147104_1
MFKRKQVCKLIHELDDVIDFLILKLNDKTTKINDIKNELKVPDPLFESKKQARKLRINYLIRKQQKCLRNIYETKYINKQWNQQTFKNELQHLNMIANNYLSDNKIEIDDILFIFNIIFPKKKKKYIYGINKPDFSNLGIIDINQWRKERETLEPIAYCLDIAVTPILSYLDQHAPV